MYVDAGWSSLVARRAHNPKAVGSNPAPAPNFILRTGSRVVLRFSQYQDSTAFSCTVGRLFAARSFIGECRGTSDCKDNGIYLIN